jgi:hypothetical protein
MLAYFDPNHEMHNGRSGYKQPSMLQDKKGSTTIPVINAIRADIKPVGLSKAKTRPRPLGAYNPSGYTFRKRSHKV